jgi:hypothetical protein
MEGVLKTDSGVFIRHSYWSNENMKKTFNQCLYAITGNEFNPKDWTNGMSCHEDDDDNYCICGHRIKNLYYIKYIPTGIQVQVGDTCVKKIDEKLHKRITSDNFCILCDEPIGKKLKVHKQGFCTLTCKQASCVGDWVFYFGNKYSKRIRDEQNLEPLTYNDVLHINKNYLLWVYENIPNLANKSYTNSLIRTWLKIKLQIEDS